MVGTVAIGINMICFLKTNDQLYQNIHYCGYCKRLEAGWGLVMKLPYMFTITGTIVYHSGGSYAQAHLAFCHLQYPQ